jgi:HK97 family phage prohead protease
MQKYTYIMKRTEPTSSKKEKVSFVASSATPDRYGDIIDVKGWVLDNYKRNNVILLNHDSNQLPIARGHVYVRNDKLIVDVEFDKEDQRAAEVERKVKAGFMNAVSVGFRPLESKSRSELPTDNKYYGQRGMYYSKAELLEVSIVTIPANGEATMLEQKFYNAMKEEILREVKSAIQDNLIVNKHILDVKEEDDRYIVSFAKAEMKQPEEIEEEIEEVEEEYKEEEEEEEKDLSEESTEDMEKADKEEEKEEKSFNDLIEAFAYILTSK